MATQSGSKRTQDRSILVESYASRFGEPRSKQEAHGYWIFATGLMLGLLGLFVLAFSTMPTPRSSAAFSGRQLAAVFGGIGLPVMMLGIVYRLPIKKTADRVALFGVLLCTAAVVAFVVYYPSNWNVASGSVSADYAALVTGLYGIGLLVIGFAALVMPTMVRKDRVSIEEREDDAFEREGAISGREESVSRREGEVTEREEEDMRREESVSRREGEVTEREEEDMRREAEMDEHEEAVSEREAMVSQREAAADKPGESKAEFEMYKDKADKWRWTLRHDNGNIIADSAEGYSSKQKAKQGLESVRKNSPDAPVNEQERSEE